MEFSLNPSPEIRQGYNGFLAVVHLALAVGAVFIDIESIELDTPIPGYLEDCPGDRIICTVPKSPALFVTHIAPGALGAVFSGVTAMAHMFYYTNAIQYENLVRDRKIWKWRAIEYALSVPPMLVIMNGLTGTLYDVSLLQIGVLGSATQFFGYIADDLASSNQVNQAMNVHLLGYPVIAAALWPMFVSISELQYTDAPSFVPFIIITQVLFFMSFGFVQLFVLTKLHQDIVTGTEQETYAKADTVYLFLSFACKATLIGSLVYSASQMDEFISGSES